MTATIGPGLFEPLCPHAERLFSRAKRRFLSTQSLEGLASPHDEDFQEALPLVLRELAQGEVLEVFTVEAWGCSQLGQL